MKTENEIKKQIKFLETDVKHSIVKTNNGTSIQEEVARQNQLVALYWVLESEEQ